MMLSTTTLAGIALWLALFIGDSNAFTASPKTWQQRCGRNSGSALGPLARNGMAYEDLELGEGRRILPGDTVSCYYVGSFQKGRFGGKPTVFDQVTDGQPFSFVVGKGEVIKGMDMGILGGLEGEISPMSVGGVRRLEIPSGLAYGEEGAGPIPANQDLQFQLEVLDARKESDISLQFRLGGYAVALGVPAVIALIAFKLLSGN